MTLNLRTAAMLGTIDTNVREAVAFDNPATDEQVLERVVVALRGAGVPQPDDVHVMTAVVQAYRVASTGDDVTILTGSASRAWPAGVEIRAGRKPSLELEQQLDAILEAHNAGTLAHEWSEGGDYTEHTRELLLEMLESVDENAHARGRQERAQEELDEALRGSRTLIRRLFTPHHRKA